MNRIEKALVIFGAASLVFLGFTIARFYYGEKALDMEMEYSKKAHSIYLARIADMAENNRKLELLRDGVNQAISECQEPKTNWIRIGQ